MADPTEPPDRTGLYWPETADDFGVILIRVDRAVHHGRSRDGAHWFTPNDRSAAPMTWADVITQIRDDGMRLSDAIRFTIPEVAP